MTAIADLARDTRAAVEMLGSSGHRVQALVVVCSAIDTLAWAGKDEPGDVTQADFCRWVAEYMRPVAHLGCTAEELYGARCAVLHSGETELRRRGQNGTSPIWFVTEKAALPEFERLLKARSASLKLVSTDDLLASFSAAAALFEKSVCEDPESEARVAERIGEWCGRFAAKPVLEALESGS